jgi:hypothetical protein
VSISQTDEFPLCPALPFSRQLCISQGNSILLIAFPYELISQTDGSFYSKSLHERSFGDIVPESALRLAKKRDLNRIDHAAPSPLAITGALHHIMVWGINKAGNFQDDEDKTHFLERPGLKASFSRLLNVFYTI